MQKIHRHFKTLLVGSISALALMTMINQPVLAQDSPESLPATQITLSPASDRLELRAGQKFDGEFSIINSGSEPFTFKVYSAPYLMSPTDPTYANASYSTDTSSTQISRWITFPQTTYNIEPGERINVPYRVSVPDSIPDGGQYAVIFAETQPSKAGMIQSKKRVGMIIYARTDGKRINKGSFSNTGIPLINLNHRLYLSPIAKNEGNTDFEATVELEALNIFGGKSHEAEKTSTVLPGTSRTISVEIPNAPLIGLMKVYLTTSLLDQKETKSQWVFFISPVALTVISLIIVGLLMNAIYGKKNKKKRNLYRR